MQPEDQSRIPRPERSRELRAVAESPAARQQAAAEGELAPFPRGQRRRNVPVRRHELAGQRPAVRGGALAVPAAACGRTTNAASRTVVLGQLHALQDLAALGNLDN